MILKCNMSIIIATPIWKIRPFPTVPKLLYNKAVILGQTGVTKSVEGGKSYFGTPIEESREKLKQLANIKKIPEILNKLK